MPRGVTSDPPRSRDPVTLPTWIPPPHHRPGIDPETGRPRKFAYPPNLLVVDGGQPQVEAASDVLAELGVTDVAVCGLAKRLEEVWLPAEPDPVILSRTSEGLYLLQRVRDEAHRFAITYHRQRRSTGMTVSELDAVPGLGPARRAALLKHFGSVRKLKAASADEIAARARLRAVHGRRGGRRARRGTRAHDGAPSDERPGIDVALISGLSGAGRSTAAKVLEDLGWFVVDNLPPALIATMVDLGARARGEITRIAVVMDVRSRAFTADLAAVIKDLDGRGYPPRLLFLEASDAVLVRRFEQVRRSHPLQGDGPPRRRDRPRARAAPPAARGRRPRRGHLHHHGPAPCEPRWSARSAPTTSTTRASRSCPSATSTGCRWTPTSSSTCASCPTRSGSPSCATRPAATSRCATTCSPRRAARSSSTATWSCWAWSGPGTAARASTTSPSPSAAPAASTAASPSARRSRGGSSDNTGMTVSVAHRDLGRE